MRAMALSLLILAAPVQAQEAPPSEGWSLMERGAQMLLDGLMTEMEPALDEMGEALSGIEPALRDLEPGFRELMTLLGDIRMYQAPEKLPNGDIIIRRKTEQELQIEGLTGPEIEL